MYRNDSEPQGQDAAGLDMFVGSGIDFLSEVTMEDMDRELFNSNLTVPWVPDHHLSPQNFVDFAPLAASLGPPGSTAEFDHRSGVSHCTSPQPSGSHPPRQPEVYSGIFSNEFALLETGQEVGDSTLRLSEASNAKAKLRDRNNRAQKRLRERKKEKAQESEKYMADLIAEMDQVRLEKAQLEERNQLLEKVLALSSKQQAPLPTKGLLALTPDTLKARLPARFDAGVQSFDPSQTLPVSVLQSDPKLMKVGDVKSMSWEQHVDIWKAYVNKLAALLATAKGDPDSEAGAEVQRTLQEAIVLCSCKAMQDPYGVQHFYLARMEEGRRLSKQKIPQPGAMVDMMANVLKLLDLGDEQKSELMKLRAWVLPQVGQLIKHRQRISQDLQTCTRDSHRKEVAVNRKNLTQAHVRAADILTELYSNLKEDQVLLFQMSNAIWRKMMTPFQLANIVVQTYPWVPDTGALLNILAAQEGQPSALELLGFADGSAAADSASTDPSAQDSSDAWREITGHSFG